MRLVISAFGWASFDPFGGSGARDLMRWSLFMWYDEFEIIKWSSVFLTLWFTRTGAPRATFPTRHKLSCHCVRRYIYKKTIIISQPNRNKTITYDFFFNRTYNQIEKKIFKSFVTIILCRGYLIVGKNKINWGLYIKERNARSRKHWNISLSS